MIPYEKSFASHEKARYWSSKNAILPIDVTIASAKIFIFTCGVCHHEFVSSLNNVNNGQWCSFCSNKKLCNDIDCKTCFQKSFSSHNKAIYFSTKNNTTARQVFKKSNRKYWFNCNNCSHEFQSTLYNVCGTKKSWCPYCCCPPQKLCENESCQLCFKKSFMSNEKMQFWSPKNKDVPRNIFKSSSKKYWFDCKKCNLDFFISLAHVSIGNWCPHCVNKTETKLYKQLLSVYPTIVREFKPNWSNNKRYDFCIPELKIIIELDGPQHFKQISNWECPDTQHENDLQKEQIANEQEYSIIRIVQNDVMEDTYDWFSDIQKHIKDVESNPDIIHDIYMCKKGEYDFFITSSPQITS